MRLCYCNLLYSNLKRNLIFEFVTDSNGEPFAREATNHIFNTPPLQMRISYVLELPFCIYDLVTNDDVVTILLIRTLRGGFIVTTVDSLDINCSPLEMK